VALSDDALVEAVENGLLWMPAVPGQVVRLAVEGIQGWGSSVPHPIANWVGAARLDAVGADDAIGEVVAMFEQRDCSFFWAVGPASTPADLGERLEAQALMHAAKGMARLDLDTLIDADSAIEVRALTSADRDAWARTMTQAFPVPPPLAELYADVALMPQHDVRITAYGAYLDGADGPVGVGMLVTPPGSQVAVLAGAATLEAHRGKGVYTSLVARRLADAKRAGAEAAAIQASSDTLALCTSLGFSEVCDLDIYLWMPPEQQGGSH
jgi:GNAT superfamily N-acetyltransferase